MNRRPWPEEHNILLKQQWSATEPDGSFTYTTSQIAAALGVTRNAVIGRAHRLDLPTHHPARSHKPQGKRHLNKILRVAVRQPIPKSPIEGVTAVNEPEDAPVSILRARSRQCRSVLDQRGEDGLAMFCGARTELGWSFCPTHAKLYYNPINPRQRENWTSYAYGGTSAPSQAPSAHQGTVGASNERGPGSSDQPEAEPETRNGTAG